MLEVNQNKFLLALAKAEMTTTDLENKSKVGRTTISKIMNGSTKIKPAIVGKLAKALNVDVEQIVDFK
ncbi:helix-turn-helix domain-containing protein [Clostridium tyrobutyricum]|jgi:transcriptional regulator with XRE-family HTH domain|uniref:helix-turn-helix domain-containing protein n=1 Tax=Clostridium tyrobutyricum TaxID=1519 RepID=UPI0018A90F91|nr:helix-turn-helix transcriptional regulator [Clostridium tyrobutyricum]